MSEEKKGCSAMEQALTWLKVTDSWAVGGYQNKLPRMCYVAVGLVLVLIIL
ncbi:MAG: hypothetical protein WCP66_03380 [Methylococcales bacterium]